MYLKNLAPSLGFPSNKRTKSLPTKGQRNQVNTQIPLERQTNLPFITVNTHCCKERERERELND